jgi:4-amino-4-deoxy-L-arabinose transferase-like glycosyltransferase
MSTPLKSQSHPHATPSALTTWLIFFALFFTVYFASLFTPPLMDDVDSSHAQTAQHIIDSGNWITTQTNGMRYIEKPPLPFWLVTIAYKLFGENAFATHLPNALAILGLTWLAWLWARRAWDARAGLYAGLAVLTSVGPFLFTRFIIPESILSLLLLIALYSVLTSLEDNKPRRIYFAWAALALALLIKGLIAPVFLLGGVIPYLWLSGQSRRWRELRPLSGSVLFLAIAAPWHILVGLANRGEGHPVGNIPTLGNVHGWWYFYFINEHVLRFFGKRYPHDYNKLPALAYWLLHLVWLFPWSLFLPALFAIAWKTRRTWLPQLRQLAGTASPSAVPLAPNHPAVTFAPNHADPDLRQQRFRTRAIWLLSLFSAFSLLFFSISTNQEYYTFPVWPPLFILIAGLLATTERSPTNAVILSEGRSPTNAAIPSEHASPTNAVIPSERPSLTNAVIPSERPSLTNAVILSEGRSPESKDPCISSSEASQSSEGRPTLSIAWITNAQAVFAIIGILVAAALAWGLWDSRALPYVPDIGTLLAHRAVGNYTLSMSHFFDLTGPSFAALRLPASLAAGALLTGPAIGWLLRRKGKHLAATLSIALTMAVFLIAAHIAFARFSPMLSSERMAETIMQRGTPADTFIIMGEQSDASSIVFYTHNFFHGKPADVVLPRCGQHGEGSTLLWGSCYTDAPDIFLSDQQLQNTWGTGNRKWLFAQDVNQLKAEHLLAGRLYLVQTVADKDLWTDRPLQ